MLLTVVPPKNSYRKSPSIEQDIKPEDPNQDFEKKVILMKKIFEKKKKMEKAGYEFLSPSSKKIFLGQRFTRNENKLASIVENMKNIHKIFSSRKRKSEMTINEKVKKPKKVSFKKKRLKTEEKIKLLYQLPQISHLPLESISRANSLGKELSLKFVINSSRSSKRKKIHKEKKFLITEFDAKKNSQYLHRKSSSYRKSRRLLRSKKSLPSQEIVISNEKKNQKKKEMK